MHIFEEEISIFIGCSGALADSIPGRNISECSRCAERRHSLNGENCCFLAGLQLLFVFGLYLCWVGEGFVLLNRTLCKAFFCLFVFCGSKCLSGKKKKKKNVKSSVDGWILTGGAGLDADHVGFNFRRPLPGSGSKHPLCVAVAEGRCLQTSAPAERSGVVVSTFLHAQRVVSCSRFSVSSRRGISCSYIRRTVSLFWQLFLWFTCIFSFAYLGRVGEQLPEWGLSSKSFIVR